MEYGKMGKSGYTTLRLSMLPYGVIFPPYDQVSKYKNEHVVPANMVLGNIFKLLLLLSYFQEEFKDDHDTVIGLGYRYRESLVLSVQRLINLLNLNSGKFRG